MQDLIGARPLDENDAAELDRVTSATLLGQEVVAVKVWSVDSEVLYSPNRALMGMRFPVDADLGASLNGAVTANLTDLDEPENVYERGRFARPLQVYLPVRQDFTGATIAVAELYQLPDQLEAEVARARLQTWLLIGLVGWLTYLLLAGIVKRRVWQETLSNATRHGESGAVLVEIRGNGDELELTVTDEGPGFVPTDVNNSGRLGLIGMRERAELLGGSFEIRSEPGKGTLVHARWPLGQVEEEWPNQHE